MQRALKNNLKDEHVFNLFHNLLNDTLSTALTMLCETRT